MTLDEYRASDDANAFWRLDSGDHQNLLDEAIDRIEELEAHLIDLNRENYRLASERNVDAGRARASAQHYMQIAEDAGKRIDELEAENGDKTCAGCVHECLYGCGRCYYYARNPAPPILLFVF